MGCGPSSNATAPSKVDETLNKDGEKESFAPVSIPENNQPNNEESVPLSPDRTTIGYDDDDMSSGDNDDDYEEGVDAVSELSSPVSPRKARQSAKSPVSPVRSSMQLPKTPVIDNKLPETVFVCDKRIPPVNTTEKKKYEPIVADNTPGEPELEEEENLVSCMELYNICTRVGPEHSQMFSNKNYILIIDARQEDLYAAGHIICAVNLVGFEGHWRMMLQNLRGMMGGNTFDDQFDMFPDYIIVYDEQGLEQDGDVHPLAPGRATFTALKQLELDQLIPTSVLFLRGGYTSFSNLYPFICTTSLENKQSILPYPSELISKSVYIGSWENAQNYQVLCDLGITHIVNCSPEAPSSFENNPCTYLTCSLNVKDNNESSLASFFKPACEFIENAISKKKRVLIHCAFGVSRGPAVAISYIMKRYKISLADGLERVKSCRNIIGPGLRFLDELGNWEDELLHERISFPEELESLKVEVDELKFPQQIPTFKYQNIYWGTSKNSMEKGMLEALKINVIFNLAKEIPCTYEESKDIIYFHYKLSDRNDSNFRSSFVNIVKQLEYTASLPSTHILVHCNRDDEGKQSRSQTILTALIMHSDQISLEKAHDIMKQIIPHTGRLAVSYKNLFSSALLQYEVQLFGKKISNHEKLFLSSSEDIKSNVRRNMKRPTIIGKVTQMS